MFIGKHKNQSILGPRKCLPQRLILHGTCQPWEIQGQLPPEIMMKKKTQTANVSVLPDPSFCRWPEFYLYVLLIFLKNFQLKISLRNHIYLRKKELVCICFLYNIPLWGSNHENTYTFKILVIFFHISHSLLFFLSSSWLGSFLEAFAWKTHRNNLSYAVSKHIDAEGSNNEC